MEVEEQGKARFLGVTGYPLEILMGVAKAAPVDTILSYCHYNLLIDDMDDSLTPFCREMNLGLINASGLHMGVLTDQGAPAWHPAPPEIVEAGRKMAQLWRQRGADISHVALRFCFDHPSAATTLVGMSKAEDEEPRASGMKNDPALLQELTEIVAPVHNRIWPSGRPENHG
jgi:L-galactose dehydrogenase